ncbi:MAG: hypothetical protein HY787_20670 [Deltaproteobacteria bacterium]|nr:hypothetical protein [Deltaproteobacteria bacterium]
MKMNGKRILTVLVVTIFIISASVFAWGAEAVSFFKTVSLGKEIRNDYAGFAGMKIKVGSKDIKVTELGRYFEKTNTESHELQIVDHKTNQILGSATLDMSKGKADSLGFKYAPLKAPITLKANMEYDIVSNEKLNSDKWFGRTNGNMAKGTVAPVAQILTQIYGGKPPFTQAGNTVNQTYGPVNFKYQAM